MGPGLYNIVQFDHDEVQEQLDRFRKTGDDSKRVEIGKSLHQLLHEETPYTFLWTLERSAAYRADNIRRIYLDNFYFFTHIDQWELEE